MRTDGERKKERDTNDGGGNYERVSRRRGVEIYSNKSR